jgi:hypothetical protein
MEPFDLSTSVRTTQWLVYMGILLVFGFALAVFVIWFTLFRKSVKKRRRKRRHRHRHHKNPTLAESGGLPPVREEEETDTATPP